MITLKYQNLLTIVVASILVPVLVTGPLLAAEQESAPGSSVLTGGVNGPDGSPLAGATVVAYHLSSERVFRSAPTDGKGQFTMTGLPYGYFDVAVETGSGLFVADVVINAAPSGKTAVKFELASGAQGTPRKFPGTDIDPVGVARVNRKVGSGEFWRSPKGIGLIGGLGGVALLALASGGSNNDPSPSGF